MKLGVAAVNVAALAAAWQHVGSYWNRKAKLPLPKTGEYNEAIGKTQTIHLNLAYLTGSWVALVVLGLIL